MSKPISWADAKTIINAYQADSLQIPAGGGQKLKGLSVDADSLRAILDNPNADIEKVFMIFAMKEDPTNGKEVTLVLAGVDNAGDLITNNAYDFCSPCPENCNDLSSHLS